jgi:FkbM family methyltransferase
MHVIRILQTRVLDPIIDQMVSRIGPKLEKLDLSRMKPFSRSKTQESVENDVFIVDIYRGLLGRDPDEVGMQGFGTMLTNGSLDRVGVIKAILTSDEYKHRQSVQQPSNEPQGCRRSEAEAVFGSFQKHHGVGRPGFVANFLGGLTDVRFVPGINSLSGFVEGYPIPGNFHGDTLEWVGTLRSTLDASDTFTMLELGAGWAPWCVIGYLAAKQRGLGTIRVIAVEGDAGHVQFIKETFATNGIGSEVGTAIHGVVGVTDGEALFPEANDASRVYSGVAAFSDGERTEGLFADFTVRNAQIIEEVRQVPCFNLATLMRDYDRVDLIHCDIQGTEADLFSSVIALVSAKVKRVVVGTHSFDIDRRLACIFAKNNWELEGINASVMSEDGTKPVILRDGVQVWRNARF